MIRPTMFVVVVALISAGSVGLLGDEDSPELVDAEGDVEYDPLHTGGQDHDYLDVLAAWFDHDNQTDVVTFTLKVVSAEALESPALEYEVYCQIVGEVWVEDSNRGSLSFTWRIDPEPPAYSAEMLTNVSWRENTGSSAGPRYDGTSRPLGHTFEATYDAPGYFVFGLDRGLLLNHGDEIRDLSGSCTEIFPSVGYLYVNTDGAASQAAYTFSDLRRTPSPGDDLEPREQANATMDGEDSPKAAPALAAVTVALVIGIISYGNSRRRRS